MNRIRIATFNVGDYTGRGFEKESVEAIEAYQNTMALVKADIWALQEDVEYFIESRKVFPYDTIYRKFGNYYIRKGTGMYNYKAFLSDHKIYHVEKIEYQGDLEFRHPWFLKGFVKLFGKEICLINLHFDWSDKYVRAEEIRQVIACAQKYEYCIIIGDFNPNDYVNVQKVSEKITYEEDLTHFKEAGFVVANGGDFGTFNTILDSDKSPYPCDNIVVTPNIIIKKVERFVDPWMYDHAILAADLEIR